MRIKLNPKFNAAKLSGILKLALATAIIFLPGAICSASAADIYFANTATGSNNGTSCGNAYAYADATHGINGSQTASWIPGNVLHICGTISGAAGDQAININGNGTAGNPITVKFEPGAVLTAPYWGGIGGAITAGGGASYITIDGGTGGTIQNTQNGYGLAYQVDSHGIYMQGGLSNIIIKNLTISNICVHTTADTTGVNCTTSGNDATSLYITGPKTNVVITQNTIHDAGICIRDESATNDTGVSIDHNTVSRCNWGINLGNGTSTGTQITNNDISCVAGALCNWDTGIANTFHHNGIMFDPQVNGSLWSGTVIANNFIHDVNPSSGYVFVDPLDYSFITGLQEYNNVGYTTPGQQGSQNGMFGASTNGLVANNTMVGPDALGTGSSAASPTIKNNIVKNPIVGELLASGATNASSDYNDFYGPNGGSTITNFGGTSFSSIGAWTAATGLDIHSITADPSLTASFTLNSGSPAIGAGANLTSLGIAGLNVGAPQTFGVGGVCGTGCVPRPSSGAWDIGAYQHGTGATTSQVPNPPTSLSATVQ